MSDLKIPNVKITNNVLFRNGGEVVLEGKLGKIPTEWNGEEFKVYYEKALEIDKTTLFVLESNKVALMRNDAQMTYVLCCFNKTNTGYTKNMFESMVSEPDLEGKLVNLAHKQLIEMGKLSENAAFEIRAVKSGICVVL